MDPATDFEISVCSVHMRRPVIMMDGSIERKVFHNDQNNHLLVQMESNLRTAAYKNTKIKTYPGFFNDSDMMSDYYLVVAYEKTTNTPLLSSRYYFDKSIIERYLRGDNNKEIEYSNATENFDLNNYAAGTIFLADRLSGNIHNVIYRQNRKKLFSLYYSEVINNNRNCTLLLMVRKEKHDKQLSNYLNWGCHLIGSTVHNGKEHNIILRDLKNV